jgi:nitroreductase
MDTIAAIETRRSVKHYDADHEMTQSEVDRLLSLAMLAPTAFNIQNWRFVLARDPELRRQLRAVAWDQAQVTDASLLVILCGDLRAWQREPTRYWRDAPTDVQDILVPAIGGYYEGKEQV